MRAVGVCVRARAYNEHHKLSRCYNRMRPFRLVYMPRVPRPRARIHRTRHPKYLHWPVAKLESNRFEMTFHLTKHKSESPVRPDNARAHPLGLRLPRDNVLSFPPGSRFTGDFHGPSGDVAKYRFVSHRLSFHGHARPVIVILRANFQDVANPLQDEFAGWLLSERDPSAIPHPINRFPTRREYYSFFPVFI